MSSNCPILVLLQKLVFHDNKKYEHNMKKVLFLAVATLSLFSCSKEVDIERASYTWVEGDSIPKKSFIMSVASIYDVDSTGTQQKLECQVTLGDSTDKNLIGSRLDLDVVFDSGENGTYKIGSNCNGTARYMKCRPGSETNVEFFPVIYTLTEGEISLENLTANRDQVLLVVDLKGSAKEPYQEALQDTVLTEEGEVVYEPVKEMVVSEDGDTSYVPVFVEKFSTKKIRINGEITAFR